MADEKDRAGTGGDPSGSADPGGTRPAKPAPTDGHRADNEPGHGVHSGDRNDMTKSDPIKR